MSEIPAVLATYLVRIVMRKILAIRLLYLCGESGVHALKQHFDC